MYSLSRQMIGKFWRSPTGRELRARGDARQILLQAAIADFLQKGPEEACAALRIQLRDQEPLARLLAVQVIAHRRLHLEAELIQHLEDVDDAVREAARQALVRLGRGTDFGPLPRATPAERARSVQRWKTWLDLQREAAETPLARAGQPAAGDRVRFASQPRARKGGISTLETEEAQAVALSAELLRTAGERQEEVLHRLRDGKGIAHTDALALAIPRLTGPVRERARAALAERFVRMTTRTLRAKFDEEDREVRRAAARACGLKKTAELIPDLIRLLADRDEAVTQAAHAALRDLSGSDFGPRPGADAAARERACAAWRDWWERQRQRAKQGT